MAKIFSVIWNGIKGIFGKKGDSKKNTTIQQGNKKNNKATNGSVINDNSQNTTNNTNISVIIDGKDNMYSEGRTAKFGLLVTARWHGQVPHKIVKSDSSIDKFNYLKPIEEDYKPPLQIIKTDGTPFDTKTDHRAERLYFLVKLNSKTTIYDFNVKRIELDLQQDFAEDKRVIEQCFAVTAAIQDGYPFAVQIPNLYASKGKISVDFGFTCDNKEYTQRFEYEVQKDGTFWIQRKYNDPVDGWTERMAKADTFF